MSLNQLFAEMPTRDLVVHIRMGRSPMFQVRTPRAEAELMARFEAGNPEAIEAVDDLTKEDN